MFYFKTFQCAAKIMLSIYLNCTGWNVAEGLEILILINDRFSLAKAVRNTSQGIKVVT
jgi:hypothetical protein